MSEGYFENGDAWTGGKYEDEPGQWLFIGVDSDGQEYETFEVPTPHPLFTLTRFDGVWTEKQVTDYCKRRDNESQNSRGRN